MGYLKLELPWPPSVNTYYRHVGNRILISRKGREYRERVMASMRRLRIQPMEGELEMTVTAHPPDKRRRDADNIMKAIFDSLQHGGVYKDDCQIKKFTCEMLLPHRPAGKVEITLKPKGSVDD